MVSCPGVSLVPILELQLWAIFAAVGLGDAVQYLLLADSAHSQQRYAGQLCAQTTRRCSAHHSPQRRPSPRLPVKFAPHAAAPTVASFGGKMTRTPGILFALLVICAAAPSARAGGTVNIKC